MSTYSADAFADLRPMILPSILASDFGRCAADTADAVAAAQTRVIHLDVMDGHLVPNLSLGVPIVQTLRPHFPNLFFDVHLMIDEPVRYAPAFVKAGGQNLTIHVEAPEVQSDLAGAIRAIKALGVRVGVTMKPATPVDAVLKVVDLVDLVLVMSVDPGFGGQSFMVDQLEKCRTLRPLLNATQKLEIDGGIGPDTIGLARAAGVDWFVVGSALYGAKDRNSAARQMLSVL